jgi:hypothetical protein
MTNQTTTLNQPIVSNGNLTNIKCVLNLGNDYTKIAIVGQDTIVDGRGVIFSPDSFDGVPFEISARGGSRNEVRQPWLLATGGQKPMTVAGGDGKATYALPSLVGQLWHLLGNDCEIDVFVLCHDPAKLANGIRANLDGVFTIAHGGLKKRLEIRVSGVAREGYGLRKMIGDGVAVTVDGGGGTCIFTRYVDGRIPAPMGCTVLDGFGSIGLVNHLLNNNFDSYLGNHPTATSVRRFMTKATSPLPQYAVAMDSYVAMLLNELAIHNPGIFNNADRIIWCGGLAKNRALTAAFKRVGLPGFAVASNPQTADVDGVLAIKFN